MIGSAIKRVARVARFAARSTVHVGRRVPGTVRGTRAGAADTTSALQTLPDSTLRGLAATSVGVGAGLYLGGAPRIVVAAGVVPALVVGAAIILRPDEPAGDSTEGSPT